MRYLARKYDLYGSNPKEAALIDMVYDGTVDQRDKLLRVVWTKGDFVRRSWPNKHDGSVNWSCVSCACSRTLRRKSISRHCQQPSNLSRFEHKERTYFNVNCILYTFQTPFQQILSENSSGSGFCVGSKVNKQWYDCNDFQSLPLSDYTVVKTIKLSDFIRWLRRVWRHEEPPELGTQPTQRPAQAEGVHDADGGATKHGQVFGKRRTHEHSHHANRTPPVKSYKLTWRQRPFWWRQANEQVNM